MPKSEEQCKAIRDNMKSRILNEASLYFARNGFGDTKISDLARHIGIAQGTIYLYFKSKEDLYDEIRKTANTDDDIKKIKTLVALPVSARKKAELLSQSIIRSLNEDSSFAVRITLSTQLIMEQGVSVYDTELYKITSRIVSQGQKEGTAPEGDVMLMTDMFWGTVYLYSLKKLFSDSAPVLSEKLLARTIVLDESTRKGGSL